MGSRRLPSIPNPLIGEIFERRQVVDDEGRAHPLHSAISAEYARALYGAVLARRPRTVVEIGMAFGISTLAILTALREIGADGRLISIDPRQSTGFHGIGLANVRRAGLDGRHELIEAFDYAALPRLLERGTRPEFAYIDGWHTFDYTLLDFFYLDKLLEPGGVIGFNDAGWRSVHKVLGFVRTHRKYREIDVGLARDYRGINPLGILSRWWTARSHADRYFEKLEAWEPKWDFFARF
jgi:predicted O-methyltransferase YrrM